MKREKITIQPDDVALNPHFREHERALLGALLQATDYGILLSGLDRQDILANRKLGELFRIPPEEIVLKAPEVVLRLAMAQVKDTKAFVERIRGTYSDPNLSYEDEIELKGEPPRFLRRSTAPVMDREGQPIARLWTFLDITETKQLQAEVQAQLAARTEEFEATSEALRAMNALSRTALEQHEQEEVLIACIEAARSHLGFESAAILFLTEKENEFHGVVAPTGSLPKSLHLPQQRDRALVEALEFGEEPEATPFMFHKEHRGALARTMKCPLLAITKLSRQEKAVGVLAVGLPRDAMDTLPLDRTRLAHLNAFRDQVNLTLEAHRLQWELRAAMESLRATQSRLIEVEKLRTAGTLAASIAHDIRNILTSFQMDLALQPEPVNDVLCGHINRFSALTHRLLAFSRPDMLESLPTPLPSLLERIVALVASQAEINNVEIVFALPKRLPSVLADASQIERLFVNLCLNAIQAMTERGGRLTLRARTRKEWVEVEVEDTGCGILPEVMPRLFDPFFTTRATGTGLGLFSCKRIVEEHGGQLSVDSIPGQGATFTVLLPRLPEERPHAKTAARGR
jgi:signal transduction histidine kinase